MRALKQEAGGPILVAGSRSVVHALRDAGLVDELHLQVFPLILSSGIRFFPDMPEPIRVEHVASRSIGNGVVLQTYRVPG